MVKCVDRAPLRYTGRPYAERDNYLSRSALQRKKKAIGVW